MTKSQKLFYITIGIIILAILSVIFGCSNDEPQNIRNVYLDLDAWQWPPEVIHYVKNKTIEDIGEQSLGDSHNFTILYFSDDSSIVLFYHYQHEKIVAYFFDAEGNQMP